MRGAGGAGGVSSRVGRHQLVVLCVLVLVLHGPGGGPGGGVEAQGTGTTPSTAAPPARSATCETGSWSCGRRADGSPECIPMEWRCDDKVDCTTSRNDEDLCPTTDKEGPCKSNQTACGAEECIPTSFVCDRVKDCPDGSDESANCTYTPCPADHFSCKNDRHCIADRKSVICNGVKDCGDASDEAEDLCSAPKCPAGQYMCKNGKCIDSSLVCSGSDECGDNSDEDPSCGENECTDKAKHGCSHHCNNINIKYYCSCDPGYELKADNRTCQDINECETTPLVCSQYCQNMDGNYTCSCTDGYMLNKDNVCVHTGNVEPIIIYANRYQIRRITLNGTQLGRQNEENEYVHVLDFYISDDTTIIFFADAGKGQIKRMLFNGSDERAVIKHNLPLVEGLAVDWINDKLYWTDSRLGGLFVAQMNGSQVKTLHTEIIKLPRAIAVDPAWGYLYWTDWQLGAYIGRMGMDGSGVKKLITEGLFWPNALTIDYVLGRFWWADAHLDRIESAKMDGTGRYIVGANLPHIYGINVFEEWMYWTDWNIKTIERANRFTGENRQQLAKMVHQPYDIHILHPLRQNRSIINPCRQNNGGCSHLCLLAPGTVQGRPSYSCACHEHFVMAADKTSCLPGCDNNTQFLCGRDDHRCITKRWLCDGSKDCLGGEDEQQNCPATIACEPGTTACKDGDGCVRDPRDICDGVEDCTDESDEDEAMCKARLCLPTEYRCSSGRCIPEQWKCDNDPDCPDQDDENGCFEPRNCTVGEFACANGKCIPELWHCDYDDDCGDQSDEPRGNCTQKCREGWRRCATNHRCIPELLFCDGDDDCRDNSDEDPTQCPPCGNGEFECDNGNCIPKRWRCDFRDDCKDNSDEDTTRCADLYVACEENEFRCKNQKCIRDRYRCDHDDDCNDGSDEESCETYTCPDEGFFQCLSGHCVLASFRCDGVRHCEDLSDERGCPTRYPGGRYCPEDEFQCNSTVCIPKSWVCDAEDDCGDRSDETPALCAARPCDSDDRFRCKNNYCIRRSALCDTINDCGDGSDENNFNICVPPSQRCNLKDFKCANGNCVPMPLVCNGQKDCTDGSDEDGCHSLGTGSCSDDNGGCEKNCTQLGANYFCSCNNNPGLRIDPTNKKLCIDIDECAAYKTNYCDQLCFNLDGSYECGCATDFTKVPHPGGQVCKANLATTETILIAMENTIRQYRLSQRLYTDVITSRSEVRALDVDGNNNLVYWTDPRRKTVFRSWVPMEPSEVSLPQDLQIYNLDIVPEGIAYDWMGKNIYITDAKAGRIVVGKSDGRYLKTIIDPSPRRPTRIAVSSTLGMMFWVDTVNRKIESAWMDGTNIRTLVSVNVSDATSIVVDHYMNNSRLFWADTKRNVIESCKVDGTDRVIIAHKGLSNPFAVDVFETQLFWVSQRNRTLYELDKFGRGINITHTIQRNLLRPMDVKIQHKQKQPPVTIDRCASKGCYPLCVLIPNGARCMCPDGDSFTRPNTCNSPLVRERELPKPCVCQNGGTCALQPDLLSVFCLCQPGWRGDKCETPITTRPTPTPTTTGTWLPPEITTPSPQRTTSDKGSTKGPGSPNGQGGSGGKEGKTSAGKSNDLTAVIVAVVIVIVILAIIIIVVVVLYRRGVIGTKSSGGVFRPGAPGLTGNGNMDNHYETPVVTFDPKDGGHANASFENPYYDTVHPNNNEAMGAQEYATTLPTKS